MSFGTELQGKPAQEALIGLQDFEIKLLEHIRKNITLRIKIDREYSSSLSSWASNIAKFDISEYDTPFSQVWKVIGRETESLSNLVRDAADKMGVNILDKVQQIISEKKTLRKLYLEERCRLENECYKMSDEIVRLTNEYSRALERLQRIKWKYNGGNVKGKPQVKFDEVKSKLLQQDIRVHQLHNEYVLSLEEGSILETQFNGVLLPSLMQFQQNLQINIIKQCQEIFTEFVQLLDLTTSPFQQINKNMLVQVHSIDPIREYNSFINKHKVDPMKSKGYDFSIATPLPVNEIVFNDVTKSSLNQRKSDYSGNLAKCQHWLSCKIEDLGEAKLLSLSVQSGKSGLLNYLAQCRTVEMLNKDILEYRCLEDRCSKMIVTINEAMNKNSGSQYSFHYKCQEAELPEVQGRQSISAVTGASPAVQIKSALHDLKNSVMKWNRKSDVERTEFSTSSANSEATNLTDQVDFEAPCIQNKVASLDKETSLEEMSFRQELSRSLRTSLSNSSRVEESVTGESFDESTAYNSLETEDWYHGVMPREEVQKLLSEDGDFLVRMSRNKQTDQMQPVLSVLWNEAYKHFIILQNELGEYKLEGAAFKTVQDLVWHHYHNAQPVTKKSAAILKRPVPRENWELRNDDIELKEKIGSGQFGEVYRGVFKSTGQEVGIKTCRETMTEQEKLKFLQEGQILKQYDHPNIVKFIGIAVHRHPVMIVMEFVPGGSLVTYLRRRGSLESVKALVKICIDVASGMAYLEGKNCLHRDLAARNCLVGEKNIVKISDFGMSREEREYVISGGPKQIPVKWTAPEALNYGLYTWACDVWSFGILAWEVFSEGDNPYPGLSNSEARSKVDSGYRMSKPTKCPTELYELISACWSRVPLDRPHFSEICLDLKRLWDSTY